ncbi:MAG TPA: glycosyltransferase family 2 protein [Gemmatimonadales bacterium]|nr:glycosyltransferase family 2 protein [Gemmatimonadales bacterium]
MPAPLTVVIPTLNEANQIDACVRELAWAREVIVVDAGSRDGTAAAAEAAGARVLNDAPSGIAAQRNAGIAAASQEWVFALDADERIGAALAEELAVIVVAPRYEAYRVKRRNRFHGRVVRRGHWGRDWVVRLCRRDRRYGGRTAHPGLELSKEAAVGTLTHELEHTPYRDVSQHVDKIVAYGRMSAADLAAEGRGASWSDLILRPSFRFLRDYVLNGSVLDGRLGIVHAGMSATSVFIKYAFLRARAERGE